MDKISEVHTSEVCITDMLQLLTKDGYENLCCKYGQIKNIFIDHRENENHAYVMFEDTDSMLSLINDKDEFPMFLKVEISHRIIDGIHDDDLQLTNDDEVSPEEIVPEDPTIGQSVYLGNIVSPVSLVESSKKLKLKNNIIECYHLDNDDLYGKPLNVKWENMNKPDFVLHKNNFDSKFKNCGSGELMVEKKLSNSVFVGWTLVVDGVCVLDALNKISTRIENSDCLTIRDLEHGMLVGAFDNVTKLYCRGYIILLVGNGANVALCDIGRVIHTADIRALPESFTQIPAYSFKGYTKSKFDQQLTEGKSYAFTVKKESDEHTILLLKSDSASKIKAQIKYWEPTVEESGVPYVNFKSGSSVELLKMKNMNSLMLRSRETRHVDIFFSVWNNVSEYCYKNREPLKREPFYGEIIGYKLKNPKNYVRGRIHKYLGDNVYSVKQMIDPVKDYVNLSDMIGLNYEEKCMPQSYINVGLMKYCQFPIQFEAKELIDLMKGVILIADFDDSIAQGWKSVNLTIRDIKENLNEMLYGLVEPLWLKENSDDVDVEEFGDYCVYDHLFTIELEINSINTMHFVKLYNGVIYLRDNYFSESFLLLNNMIKEYCSTNLAPYLPHNGEVCLGQCEDGDWHRIVCENVKPGRMIQSYFIDIGVIAFLTTRQCKKFPRELIFEPTHVYTCYLDLSGTDIEITVDKLNELLKYEEKEDLEFTVVEKLDIKNSYLIKCPFFENVLK